MKTTLKNLSRGGQLYEAPALEVIEIDVENVICGDSLLGGAGYGGGDNDLGEI